MIMNDGSDKKVGELVEQSMKNLGELIDVDHVVGTPIAGANGRTLIPVSKVTVGYLSGGSDIGVKMFAADGSPFAGGSGVVVSLKPAGFLCDDGAECRYIRMEGQPVFRFAVEALPRCAREVAEKAGITLDQVDRFVLHQANQRIINFAVKKLGVDPAKCTGNIEHTANTSAASVPILLDELVQNGDVKPGDKVLCVGFGGGLTWAGALLEVAQG